MIVNIEQADKLVEGQLSKELIISYVNKTGTISYLRYSVPPSQMFNWVYTNNVNDADLTYMSWDNKKIKKIPTKYLSNHRIYEILNDLGDSVSCLYEFNMPKTSFCDIEVDVDENGFPEADTALNKINTISWAQYPNIYVFGNKQLNADEISKIQLDIDKHCEKFKVKYNFTYIYHENEADMLYDFLYNYMRHAPAVTGWNFWGYDWPYIVNRCNNLNLDINWLSPSGTWKRGHRYETKIRVGYIDLPLHKLIYDYLMIYLKWDTSVEIKENNTLDFVANAVLDVKKVQHQLGFIEMYKQNYIEYVFYNAIDSILVEQIDKKIKTSSVFLGLANLTKVEAISAFSPVNMMHVVMGNYAYKNKRVFPKVNRKNESEGYEGAFVYEPIPNVYKWVVCLDFASLYPTTMRQFNISPENFIKKDKSYIPKADELKCVSGAVFKNDKKYMLPEILDDFYAKRKSYKKEMKIASQELAELEKILEERLSNVTVK